MSSLRKKRHGELKFRGQTKYFKFLETLEERRLLSFTIAVIPDTQHMVWVRGGDAAEETAWVASQKTAQNIQFTIGLGDIVNDGASDQNEWIDAQTAWNNIAGMGLPFGTAQGNHDHDNWAGHPFPQTGWNSFTNYFGPSTSYYSGKSWWGMMPTTSPYYNSGGTNSFQKFTADGQTFLNICLEDEPSDLALQWADSVMAANPGMPTIITTHEFIDQNGSFVAVSYHNTTAPGAPDTPSGANSGSETWNWAKTHDDQIFMILCGHASGAVQPNGWAQANHHATWTGANGKPILVQMTDYQENIAGPGGTTVNGGAEWVRMMTFDLTTRTIRERTYSPLWGNYSDSIGVTQPFNEPISESDFTVDISAFTQIPGTTLPNITIAATGSPSETGPTTGTYTLTRTGSTASALTVNIAMSGTATNGTDYTSIGTTAIFAAGSATKTITLTPVNDANAESTESATLTITAGTGYAVGSPSSATLNILDNDSSGSAAVYESFNYTAGDGSNIAGHNTGTGLSANWTVSNNALVNILSGSLSYTAGGHSLQTAANSINVTNQGSATGTQSAAIGTPGTTTWIGFLMNEGRISGSATMNGEIRINSSGLRLGSPLGGNFSAIATGNIYLQSGVPVVPNTTYFVVYKIQYLTSGDIIDLFINPTPGVTPTTPNASLTLPATTQMPVSSGLIVKSNNDATVTSTFDEIRIGNSYLAIAPEATNPVPNAPSNCAVAPSGTSLNVTWTDNSTNETQFHVWRSTDNVSFGVVFNSGANVTSWLDTTVSAGTLYYYKVNAENANGSSGYSNTASATAPNPLPAAPSNLVTGVPGTSSLSMTWTDNATNETGFKVYRSTDNATWGSAYATIATANTTSYTDNAPSAGVAYFYKVTAYNAGGESAAAGMTCEVATVQAADRFNYTAGDGTNLAGHNTGVGLSANWTVTSTSLVNVISGSLSYTAAGHALTTSGNSVQATNFASASGTMATTIGTPGTTTWIGFLMNSTRISGSSTINAEIRINSSQLRLGSPLGGNVSAIVTGNIYLPGTVQVLPNTTYFVVYRVQYLTTGDIIDMFVNPTPGVTPTTPSGTLTLPATVQLAVSSGIVVKSNNDATVTNRFDEIRIGSSYAAVAPDPIVAPGGQPMGISKRVDLSSLPSSGRKLGIGHISTLAPVSMERSVFEERSAYEAPIAGARSPDASTNPSDDAGLLKDDFWLIGVE